MDEYLTDVMRAPGLVGIALLALACVIAGWMDVIHRRIPNWLCASTALMGLLFAAIFLLDGAGVASHTLHMLAALLAGMALFSFSIFGGGDAKFYAAVAAWFPLDQGIRLLVCVTSSGLALLIVWFVYRRIRGYPIRQKNGSKFDALPYGLAIGIGALAAMLS